MMIVPIQDIQGLVFTEYINIEDARKIVANWNAIINDFPECRKKQLEEKKKDFDPLISLKKICKNKTTINNVNYLPSKNLKNMGRLFAQSASLQNLPREFRGAIGKNYHDLDMVNAHPSILLQYCQKNEIKCDELLYYVQNRNEVISKIMADFNMEKADVKQLMLSVMNGGKRDGITDPFFVKFKKECERIHTFIASLNPKLVKEVSKRKDFNVNGSITNIILCNLENEILLYTVQYLIKEGFHVDVLVFDGCMVRKEENKLITPEVLGGLSGYVFEKCGYKIDFTEKELDTSIDLTKYQNVENDDSNTITYFKDKEKFEQNHLKIVHPPIYITLERGQMHIQSETELIASYKTDKTSMKIDLNGKELITKTSFIKAWVNDENIRKYDRLVFTPPPQKHDQRDYNTWMGFDNEKIPLPNNFNVETNEYVARFKEYIANLVNDREEYVNYIIAWIANMIQYPSQRSQVCIILYSIVEGVGKSKLIELIEKVIGEKYSYAITDVANGLFGKHSMAEFEKLFISLSEIKGKDTYSNTEAFKSRITDPKRDYEPKGLKGFNAINYCNYICGTNQISMVNAGENDRRFCVITCNNKKASDKNYFLKFDSEVVNNEEAVRCIFEYLQKFPIESHVPNRLFQLHRPTNDALYQDLKEYNREIEWNFLEHYVKQNKHQKIFKIETKTLWASFESFLERNGEKRRMEGDNSKKFHFRFKQRICQVIQNTPEYSEALLYSTREKRIAMNGNDCYQLNIEQLKKYLDINFDYIDDDDEA